MFKKGIVCLFLAVAVVFSIGVFLDSAHAWNVAVSPVDYPCQSLDPTVVNFYKSDGSSDGDCSFDDGTGQPEYIADIDYDQIGILYAFTYTGIWKRDTDGEVFQINDFSAPTNYGGDISMSPDGSIIAASRVDYGSGGNVVYFFDSSNGSQVDGCSFSGYVADIEYDQTGNLYAFTSTGIWKRDTGGNVCQINNFPAPTNYGGDLSISPDGFVIAASQRDYYTVVHFFDAANGALIETYDFDDHVGQPEYVADIEYDETGNLYAFTSTGIWKRDTDENVSLFTDESIAPVNCGGDITINPVSDPAAVPGPTTMLLPTALLLFGYGLLTLRSRPNRSSRIRRDEVY